MLVNHIIKQMHYIHRELLLLCTVNVTSMEANAILDY